MTIREVENFYEQDSKKYKIEKNDDFLKWVKSLISNGYRCYIKTDEMQDLIDKIANWYEIKYPEREFEHFEGIRNIDFQDIKSISNVMDVRQLFFRLSHNQLRLMECGYRAKGWGQHPIYDNGKKVGWKTQIFMRLNKKNEEKYNSWLDRESYFLLHADHLTGKVLKSFELEEYLDGKEDLNLDELLSIFKGKYTDELDFTELKESVYNHNCDLELRHKVLQFVALKLLYSKNTSPERGYERAKRFINEFNKELDVKLTTKQIDEIVNKDYSNVKKNDDINIHIGKLKVLKK